MPFNLGDYLRKQSIRMLRDNWIDDTRMLSQEIYTILRHIQVEETGPVSIVPPEGGDPVDFPGVEDIDIPPFDLDQPGGGPNDPEVEEQTNTYTRTVTYFPNRVVFPGQILSQASGANYNVRIYPNGNLTLHDEQNVVTRDVVAQVTDESLAGTIAPNSWVYVFWVAEYLFTQETFRSDLGDSLGTQSQLKVAQEEFLFVAPGSSGGGKVARVTVTITGRSGLTAGQGRAILYDFGLADEENPSPTFTAGEEVDVYNMVSSEIEAGADKFIQVKRIDNAWFIDVEDCAAGSA